MGKSNRGYERSLRQHDARIAHLDRTYHREALRRELEDDEFEELMQYLQIPAYMPGPIASIGDKLRVVRREHTYRTLEKTSYKDTLQELNTKYRNKGSIVQAAIEYK